MEPAGCWLEGIPSGALSGASDTKQPIVGTVGRQALGNSYEDQKADPSSQIVILQALIPAHKI